MKILCALFTAFLCLQFRVVMSGEPLLQALHDLVSAVEQTKNSAFQKLSEQYSQVATDMDRELNQNILPSLQGTYSSIESSLYNLETRTDSVGYNYKTCALYVNDILANLSSTSAAVNVTAKAIEEKTYIYDTILHDTHLVGQNNLNLIIAELSSITEEFVVCVKSANTDYCSTSLYKKMLEKQEKIPQLLEKETQTSSISLVEQGLNYKNRGQDYVKEVIRNAKPYLSLVESCVQRLITTGKVK